MTTETVATRVERLLGTPLVSGNQVDVLRNGDEIFPAMLDAIRAAEISIDFLTFVYWTGEIAEQVSEALTARAEAGVSVRVLLDALGARRMQQDLVEAMRDAGAVVEYFRPPSWKVWEVDHRTHRKILVCDGSVGFTGGVGIAEEWSGDARNPGEWRDTHLRIEGPAVSGLEAAFITNWVDTGRPILPLPAIAPVDGPPGTTDLQIVRGAATIGLSDMAVLLRAMVASAEHRLRITTPYFSPDQDLKDLLVERSAAGVSVEILVPGEHHDKRFVQLATADDVAELLDCGVEMSAFQATMLHAKVVTVDGSSAVVGSANINQRSMARDAECSVVIHDPTVVAILDRHFDEDLARAERIDPERWADRPVSERMLEVMTRPLRSRI